MNQFVSRAWKRALQRGFARATTAVALTAFLAALLPVSAFAGQWRQNEVKWHKSSVGSPTDPTAIYIRDTVKTVIAASIPDTTGSFTLKDADVWPGNGAATVAAVADTVLVGWLLFQSDTSVAISSAVTSITYEIDGRAAGIGVTTDNAQGWTQVDTAVVSVVADAAFGGTIAIPIAAKQGIYLTTLGAGALVNSAYFRLMAYNELRVRITATTGIMGAARVWFRWWDED